MTSEYRISYIVKREIREGEKMARKEIVVKENHWAISEASKSYLDRIYDDLDDIRKSFIRLGFHLAEIQKCEYYKSAGYPDFYEFCEYNYALSRSSVQRYILVWYKFADYDPVSSSRKMWISEKYEAFNFSQLVEMASMEHIENIKPEMTVKEIREFKKNLSKSKSLTDCALSLRKICDKVQGNLPDVAQDDIEDQLDNLPDVAPEKCRFDESYLCKIEAIIKKHFMKNGDIVGCAGCCQCCTDRNVCEYVCDAVKNQKCDVAQKETVSDESEIDMQRDRLLEQLDRVRKAIDSSSMVLTLMQMQNISDEMNVLQGMIMYLH